MLLDADLYAGAVDFLASHSSPDQWRWPEDVDAWLEALREFTPYPAFSLHQVEIPPRSTAGPAPTTPTTRVRDAQDRDEPSSGMSVPESGAQLGTYPVNMTFEVSARSRAEAEFLVDQALIGGAPPGTPAAVQQRLRVLGDGDVWGVLGWHRSGDTGAQETTPVEAVLRERARELDPGTSTHSERRDPGTGHRL